MANRELKSAFLRGMNSEGMPVEAPIPLSEIQKSWLTRAWTAKFGFVPEAIPRYNEARGFFYVPVVQLNWHHIRGANISVLYDGADPNRPENIVPLSARLHIGKGLREGELDDDETLIHPSAWEAFRRYREFKRGVGDNPFEEMLEDGIELAAAGQTRHFSLWDDHFRALAEEVARYYKAMAPKDEWPVTNWSR